MKNKYTVQDLLENGSFHQFVADPASDDGKRWRAWLEKYPEQAPIIEEARQLLTELNFRQQKLDEHVLDQAWDAVNKQLQMSGHSSPQRNVIYKVAAVVSLLIFAGIFYWLQLEQMLNYETGYGEIKEMVLEDGTMVQLNANSSISYHPENMLEDNREVFLNGEAYFEVSHHQHEGEQSRFLVHTSNGVVEVLGTRFNVQSRHQSTQVVLESGSVSFETRQKQKATLLPGEMLEYSEKSETLNLKKVNPRQFTAWRQQKLYFDETPLADLAKTLEDTYGKKVLIRDERLRAKKLSGEISAQDMDKVLLAVSRLFSIKISQQEDTIFLESIAQ